jgi:hypothetical protein
MMNLTHPDILYTVKHGDPPGGEESKRIGICVYCWDNIYNDGDGYFDFGGLELVHKECLYDYSMEYFYRIGSVV